MKTENKIRKLILLITCTFSPCIILFAQNKENKIIIQEYIKLWRIYEQKPLLLKLEIRNNALPVTKSSDTLHAEMDFYLGKNQFYLQSEGIEEFVNDSMIMLVNHEIKKILLYQNNSSVQEKMNKYSKVFMQDSSVEKLEKEYRAEKKELNQFNKKIVLTSNSTVGGTALPKVEISVVYKISTYEPVEVIQTKWAMVTVDSASYHELVNDQAYKGKLVKADSKAGKLYLLAKEYKTVYSFKKIEYNLTKPPVTQDERIVINDKGEYEPAKGYEGFIIEKEF